MPNHFLIPSPAVALFAAVLSLAGCDDFSALIPLRKTGPDAFVLRVHSTIQYPDVKRPWLKKTPFTREGLGTVIEGGRILVTADMAAFTTDIELETPDKRIQTTASVEVVDEECNLAVLRASGSSAEEILKSRKPLALESVLPAGSTLQILQLEGNATPALSAATISTAAVSGYPSGSSYLLYRATTTIPQRDGSYVVPALHDGKLAGLVMRYDPRTQAAEIIPSPLISRFLKEASRPGFKGLARAGIIWTPLRGSTFREWFGLTKDQGGVAIAPDRNGPALKAGLQKGDVILILAGKPIDIEGNYDDPILGKTSFGNLVSMNAAPGERLEITYFRPDWNGHGDIKNATMTLEGKNPDSEISPSLLEGATIPYTFFGGLLLQNLSRPYLREWGNNWFTEAPQNLVALDFFQNEEKSDRKRYVILSGMLPSEQTLGSEHLINHSLEKINGIPIQSLDDVTEARKHPQGGFHRIELDKGTAPIFLDASTLDSKEARLKTQFGIPASSKTSSSGGCATP